jgi:hypothetical protein
MPQFLGLLLLIGGFLLAFQSACDQFRGETAVQPHRFSPPEVIARSTKTEEFKRTMALHWFVAVMAVLAGRCALSSARRQQSMDILSPDLKKIDSSEMFGATDSCESTDEIPPVFSAPSVPKNIPVGRTLSVMICVVYVAAAFSARPILFSRIAVLYSLLAACLILIWFPDEIGEATGYFVGHAVRVDSPTPGILISCVGWFFLIGIPFLIWFLNR